ncbi:MAG: PAN domain-containing protein [Pseudolabrys sp.]|nr:PAN domain-containing protein [Pseudolabrys sp.]MBV9262376.1 PAN domain-containing protein [Pseudolabrys sp.]
MRNGRLLIGAMIVAIVAAVTPASAQIGFDRPGGDSTNFQVRTGDPAACAARCERESRCRAWSFSYPGPNRPDPVCWLKNQVTPRKEDNCCVSGVRGAGVVEPRTGAIEFSIDRPGGDYKSLDVKTDPEGASCKAECDGDNKCRAWTYVRPGYISAGARCYLKSEIKRPRHKPCCISGVVR